MTSKLYFAIFSFISLFFSSGQVVSETGQEILTGDGGSFEETTSTNSRQYDEIVLADEDAERLPKPVLAAIARFNDATKVKVAFAERAEEGQFPFQVSLTLRDTFPFSALLHFCGAIVLDQDWVLTAAHCVKGAYSSEIIVRSGLVKRLKKSPNEQIRRVEKVLIHPSFQSVKSGRDLALLKLSSSLRLDNFTLAVSGYANDYGFGENDDKPTFQVVGWGKTETEFLSAHLMFGEVQWVNPEICNTPFNMNGAVDEELMFCARGPKAGKITDACVGDSGGPIVMGAELVGVTSFGVPDACGGQDTMGVYAKINGVEDWLATCKIDIAACLGHNVD